MNISQRFKLILVPPRCILIRYQAFMNVSTVNAKGHLTMPLCQKTPEDKSFLLVFPATGVLLTDVETSVQIGHLRKVVGQGFLERYQVCRMVIISHSIVLSQCLGNIDGIAVRHQLF
ncbi:hypothetical protein I5591_08200 [Pseudomonas syringae pv. tomato]|nr:hypothetical protein [Pseudomonas syringae pv. tomato]